MYYVLGSHKGVVGSAPRVPPTCLGASRRPAWPMPLRPLAPGRHRDLPALAPGERAGGGGGAGVDDGRVARL
eukprot:scaffold67100_cov32-Phaeocystis_antarctica.AAC.1